LIPLQHIHTHTHTHTCPICEKKGKKKRIRKFVTALSAPLRVRNKGKERRFEKSINPETQGEKKVGKGRKANLKAPALESLHLLAPGEKKMMIRSPIGSFRFAIISSKRHTTPCSKISRICRNKRCENDIVKNGKKRHTRHEETASRNAPRHHQSLTMDRERAAKNAATAWTPAVPPPYHHR